jgi:hypothetical protein
VELSDFNDARYEIELDPRAWLTLRMLISFTTHVVKLFLTTSCCVCMQTAGSSPPFCTAGRNEHHPFGTTFAGDRLENEEGKMNELARPRSAQVLATPLHTAPAFAPKPNARAVWPVAVVICGLLATLTWTIFLGWFLWTVFS